LGDAKLLAAGGAWVSWEGLPSVLLLACAAALAWVLMMRWRGVAVTLDRSIPFGPTLCLGTWLVWLYGPLT
jgi:leader peptidase (prepilin peptidase)/N-methyltransferase